MHCKEDVQVGSLDCISSRLIKLDSHTDLARANNHKKWTNDHEKDIPEMKAAGYGFCREYISLSTVDWNLYVSLFVSYSKTYQEPL